MLIQFVIMLIKEIADKILNNGIGSLPSCCLGGHAKLGYVVRLDPVGLPVQKKSSGGPVVLTLIHD